MAVVLPPGLLVPGMCVSADIQVKNMYKYLSVHSDSICINITVDPVYSPKHGPLPPAPNLGYAPKKSCTKQGPILQPLPNPKGPDIVPLWNLN